MPQRIVAQFGPMQIISTCRAGARIAGSGRISKHATGEAIDFRKAAIRGFITMKIGDGRTRPAGTSDTERVAAS